MKVFRTAGPKRHFYRVRCRDIKSCGSGVVLHPSRFHQYKRQSSHMKILLGGDMLRGNRSGGDGDLRRLQCG